MAESRGGKEDMRLKKSFYRLWDEGTDYMNQDRFHVVFTSKRLKVKPKTNNISALQLADLIAHPSRQRGRTFTFLGFEFYWFKDRNGTRRAMRRTAPSKQQSALRRMKAWLKSARHLTKKQFFKKLKLKLIGHYNYYYVRGNSRAVWSYYSQVIKYTKKWLDRRSQRRSYNWEKFKRVLEYMGIPKPRPTEKRRLHQVALG